MNTIFLNDDVANINRVYSNSTIELLKKNADFTEKVYQKSDILSSPKDFKNVEYIFSTWGMPQFTEAEIKAFFPVLKCVFYAAGTVQYFAKPFLNCGVKVFSAWAANAVPVAEYAFSQIILANKGFFTTQVKMKQQNHKAADVLKKAYIGNYDSTIGIIGAGMIGQMVIERLKSCHLKILAFDPFLPDETATNLCVEKCSLEELFSNSNVVSNHLANNSQTQGILNYDLFASMPKFATFINTGRGAQVVEDDLVKVLKQREDITAILDVTYPEPPVENHGFYELQNCILTPHIAGSNGNEVFRMSEYMLSEYLHFIKNEPTKYQVTEKMLKTMA